MGDPRKRRKKYTRPSHPWQGERIQKENELAKEYGLKNKKEVWKAKSAVGKFREQARLLLGSAGEEAEKESKNLLNKLTRLGVLSNYSLEGVLALTIDDLLNRRLQTVVYRRGLANTVDQARQFVSHKHVSVGDRIIDVPGYIVPRDREELVRVVGISPKTLEKPEKKPERRERRFERPDRRPEIAARKPEEAEAVGEIKPEIEETGPAVGETGPVVEEIKLEVEEIKLEVEGIKLEVKEDE